MFEEYLFDANEFLQKADSLSEQESKKYYRASIFYIFSAIEAFVNYIGDTIEKGGGAQQFEVAFLTDRKFGLEKDEFKITPKSEYHKIEEKLRYLIKKYAKNTNIINTNSWANFKDFKKLRDSIVHPRASEDSIPKEQYQKLVQDGLDSVIDIINDICKGYFNKPLRLRLLELKSSN
ncbi:hypothetical protein POF51_07725 [Brevibacillus sp. AG]|uniref:hypothetical protein n=1 Tax=Brevibacillus sp. AG TaxID=3020891 RepID=UPI00232EDE46|nr:hypothetical protein [Brevibacillus sp. AG]MDC0760575.1 hypothetical protein [Brevibacillus sp. AG]